MNANSIQIKNIPDTLFAQFRKKARKKYGDRKGSLREAGLDALKLFNEGTLED